jgi:transposase InsO family protein
MIVQLLRPIKARGAVETAHRARQRLSEIFCRAIGSGSASVDPAAVAAILALLTDVRRLQARHLGRYGAPRMHAALRAEGHRCSRGRVERLMRRHRIRALAGRRFRPCTTDSRHYLPVAPNLLAHRFVANAPNRIWLADITYIATGEGRLYLAAVLDLATREIVGWAMRDHMRTKLPLAALMVGERATIRLSQRKARRWRAGWRQGAAFSKSGAWMPAMRMCSPVRHQRG